MVITKKNSTGTRRTTAESFQWPIRHAISLFFLKKIEGNRQALTSVNTSTRDDDSNTCSFSSFSSKPQIVYTEKSQKIKEWASREFGISHLVPTCEISFYDCCKFFFPFQLFKNGTECVPTDVILEREEWTFITLFHFWKLSLLIRDSQYKNYPLVSSQWAPKLIT